MSYYWFVSFISIAVIVAAVAYFIHREKFYDYEITQEEPLLEEPLPEEPIEQPIVEVTDEETTVGCTNGIVGLFDDDYAPAMSEWVPILAKDECPSCRLYPNHKKCPECKRCPECLPRQKCPMCPSAPPPDSLPKPRTDGDPILRPVPKRQPKPMVPPMIQPKCQPIVEHVPKPIVQISRPIPKPLNQISKPAPPTPTQSPKQCTTIATGTVAGKVTAIIDEDKIGLQYTKTNAGMTLASFPFKHHNMRVGDEIKITLVGGKITSVSK